MQDLINSIQMSDLLSITLGASCIICFALIVYLKRKAQSQESTINEMRELYEGLEVGMLRIDEEGKITYFNHIASRLLGHQQEDLIGVALSDCFFEEDRKRIVETQRAEFANICCCTKASDLFLNISFGELQPDSTKNEKRVFLHDINQLKRSFMEEKKRHAILSNTLKELDFGRFKLELNSKQITLDKAALKILYASALRAREASARINLESISNRIHNEDMTKWNKFVDKLYKEGAAIAGFRLSQLDVSHDANPREYIPVQFSAYSLPDDFADGYRQAEIIVIKDYNIAAVNDQANLSQHQLNALITATAHPMYVIDDKGSLLNYNASFSHLIRILNKGLDPKDLFASKIFPERIEQMHRGTGHTSSRPLQAQCTVQSKDNREFHLQFSIAFTQISSYLNEDSQTQIIGTIYDVTDKVDAINKLNNKSAKQNQVYDLAPIGIAQMDGEKNITTANHQLSHQLGYTIDECKHLNLFEIIANDKDISDISTALKKSGKVRGLNTSLIAKDASLIACELHIDLVNKEKQEYLIWIFDKAAEQFQKDKFETLLENSNMPMAILGLDGFTSLNDPAREFFGNKDFNTMKNTMPYAREFNLDEEKSSELMREIEHIKLTGKVHSFTWDFFIHGEKQPCHCTFIPIFKDQMFESILCMFVDQREFLKADKARLKALELQKQAMEAQHAAQQKALETQKQLTCSQGELADKVKQLTQIQAEFDETRQEYDDLKQSHENVAENLKDLQKQYSQSRNLLAAAEKTNADLNDQLADADEQVKGLHQQREDIAKALADSEKNYRDTQQALNKSEANVGQLQASLSAQKTRQDSLESEISEMQSAVSAKDNQISEVNAMMDDLQSKLSNSADTTEKLKVQLESQREARESAERERKELQLSYQMAKSELSNKARNLEHMQNEIEKLEEMSQQERGDMQAQQQALEQELVAKQAQLKQTVVALNNAKEDAEAEKLARDAQQKFVANLQQDLQEAEANAVAKHKAMAEKERALQESQQKLLQELKDKQHKLHEAETLVLNTRQESEAEQEKHQKAFEMLKAELSDIESRSTQQQAKIEQSNIQWQHDKEALREEVLAKREQLESTQEELDDIQQQAENERIARLEQEQQLAQLQVELKDVASRAEKQNQMLQSNEEQWQKHHDEIEQQKLQLQQSLQQANLQNQQLQDQLAGKRDALSQAELQVNQSKHGEQALVSQLEEVRSTAEGLKQKLAEQTEQEKALQQQLLDHQNALDVKESKINELQNSQQALVDELAKVQQEYALSKQNLSEQQDSHAGLNSQMSELESALADSQQALKDKENALAEAQQALESSHSKLAQQEQELVEAHKQELEEHSKNNESISARIPDIERLAMPSNPKDWFDLLPYLQNKGEIDSLPAALSQLIEALHSNLKATDEAIVNNDLPAIFAGIRGIISIAQEVNSDVLSDLMSEMEHDCRSGLVDNVSIRWPVAKQSLQQTMRVVYSHLHS